MTTATRPGPPTHAARLDVVARTAPELVERLCRVLRHRGATVTHLVLESDGGSSRIGARLTLPGDPDLLARQVRRLPDVDSVTIESSPGADIALEGVPAPAERAVS